MPHPFFKLFHSYFYLLYYNSYIKFWSISCKECLLWCIHRDVPSDFTMKSYYVICVYFFSHGHSGSFCPCLLWRIYFSRCFFLMNAMKISIYFISYKYTYFHSHIWWCMWLGRELWNRNISFLTIMEAFFFLIFKVWEYFAYMCIYILHVCLVLMEVRRGCQTTWSWSSGNLWTAQHGYLGAGNWAFNQALNHLSSPPI